MYNKSAENYYERRYYTVYHTNEDKTFIMCEETKNDDLISVAVVGFHFGEPYKDSFYYIEKTKTTFEWGNINE